jgi:aminoglycoside phosphotransferase (APT) family kinase protein
MHTDEVEIDLALVASLVAGQFPAWADQLLRPVTSAGTNNALFRLGDELVVRLPRIERAVAQINKEVEWLPRLAPRLPTLIPMPVACAEPAAGYPWRWAIYRWLEGETPTVDRIDDADGLAIDLGGFAGALHSVNLPGGPPSRRGVPLDFRDEPTREAIEALRDTINAAVVLDVWEDALVSPAWDGPNLWVHGDLGPGNVLTRDGRLSAVIDFGSLGVGDPACDAIAAWNLLPAKARPTYRAALGFDDATWKRGRGWALSIALIQLPYYHDTNPVLAANARHVIAEVLGEVT